MALVWAICFCVCYAGCCASSIGSPLESSLQCSKYHFEEKVLEKLVRLELKMEMYEAKIKTWEDSIPTNLDKIDNAKKQTETFLESMRDILQQEQTRLNGSFHETVENVYLKSESKVKSALDLLSYKIEEYSESQNRRENALELLRSSFRQEQKQFKQEQIRLNDSVQKTVENIHLQLKIKVENVTDSLSIQIGEFENKSENAIDLLKSSFQKEQEQFKQMKIRLNDSFQKTVESISHQAEIKVKNVLDSFSTKIGEYEKRSENALKLLHSTLLQEQQLFNDSLQATVDNIQTETESKVKSMIDSISLKMNEFNKSESKRDNTLELLQSNVLQNQDRFNQSLYLMENYIEDDLKKAIQNLFSRVVVSECKDIVDVKSGIYTVSSLELPTLKLRCEDDKWTVIQKRYNGATEFYRNWEDYENGFGDLNGEFWLGNKIIALLTSIGTHELKINLEDWDGSKRYANFKNFKIDGASDKYRLHISGYSGDAGDGMTEYNGYYFSTYDRDHDTQPHLNCADHVLFKGAWWFYNCWNGNGASLNGKYTSGPSDSMQE
ncbi:Ryncolin-2,Angiopoietin-related protein 1,Ryncolin-1,Tenascin-X,Ficolin-2,Tenascin,Ryncolin-3,Angiopoietin-related protein 2,Angiopoietin-4 [Mytilus edulis]|uniref:Ryncolin-2,Angiopoietin-related protein 1,Ryncolin-1,Tenascin-X,Ficolin-2,Tenascin,Ryncolin-3,Angio poietin-related protein 2,Angiopoietin-4 n=1 Tax=Mytilus edulis TaxID=6550 RepID=A0A8S3QBF5_MYTED|nr:Ryncolin-2,Angiopoietin-related protein 1,Ryncolin-1,Tenascin-X,Ficolin-2,Tenascin,Ryncolin-3,Angiopoietin-related protein 2,Angiopoietin-4 [Mytilus edulis]